MNIVLIGFMCSGKSRVGREIAKKLGWVHFDTDEMIVKDVGASIAEIITAQGESAFREIERKAVRLVASFDRCVISTGGGVPLDSANMVALSERGQLFWLKVSPETVLKRAGNLKSRPLIDPKDPLASIRARMRERESAYARAPRHIETETLDPGAIAAKIIESLPAGGL